MVLTSPIQRKLVLPTLTIVWLGCVAVGLAWIWQYELTPGEVGDPLKTWPVDSRIEPSAERPTLVLFAHPRCPCTRATINELGRLVARCRDRVDVQVAFFKPSGSPAGWERSDIWSAASAVPGVQVIEDTDGSEASRFLATTSGHALLFDSTGRLLFSGGITGSRGHSGDNAGRTTLETILLSASPSPGKGTPVFGCRLTEPTQTP